MIFEEQIKVKYSEMDYKLALKPSSLLNFLQDLASANAESLGFGYSYITPKNLGWFLLKYRMEFSDYPVSVYDLTLKTEPRGCQKLFAYRDFYICQGEKLLGKIASVWAVVDMTTKALVPVQPALNNDYMPLFQKRENDLTFKKLRSVEKIDIEKTFEVRYEDIDVNSHANNGNYIIWAFEPLSFNFRSSHKIKTLDIQFKKEVKYGTNVLSQIEFINDYTTLHSIKNAGTNEDLCIAEVLWEKE